MTKKEITAGDTFAVVYKHKPDGTIVDMPEAYDLAIGLRRENGEFIASFSYQAGDIVKTDTGVYRWEISHDLSKSLEGVVIIEMTVYSADYSFVQHCNEYIQLVVTPSFMNSVIDNE